MNGPQLFPGWAADRDVVMPSTGYDVYDGRATYHHAERWADLVNDANALTGEQFDPWVSMWNHYEHTNGVRFHHDGAEDAIAIVSFGADGEFALSPCDDHTRVTTFTVGDGDLLYLPRDAQHAFAHSVKSYGERFSLVLRTGHCTLPLTRQRECEHDAAQEALWGGDSLAWISTMRTDDRES